MTQAYGRTPPGKVMQMLTARRDSMRPVKFRQDLMKLEPDEFEELLRREGVSNKMVQRELVQFKILKDQHDSKTRIAERKRRRKSRPVSDSLNEYAEAELRRTLGVAANDIIREMREEDATAKT